MTSSWESLGAVLNELHATIRVDPRRVVGSCLNDPMYRIGITAVVIAKLGDPTDAGRSIDSGKLQLAQFVASRRAVLGPVLRALQSRSGLPRGFASDSVHTATIGFLVARGLLLRQPLGWIVAPVGGALEKLNAEILAAEMFAGECATLNELAAVRAKITKKAVDLK